MTDDMEILGWFFHLEAIAKGTNWPISPGGLADSKRAIDKARPVMSWLHTRSLQGPLGPR